jgi:hypothetical protein
VFDEGFNHKNITVYYDYVHEENQNKKINAFDKFEMVKDKIMIYQEDLKFS